MKNYNQKIIYYTYIYLDPRIPGKYSHPELPFCLLFQPFYVGKGHLNRMYDHIKQWALKKNTHKNNRIKLLLSEGTIPIVHKICISESDALTLEEHLISCWGRVDYDQPGILLNVTKGGEGISGYQFNKFQKKELSEKTKLLWQDPSYIEKQTTAKIDIKNRFPPNFPETMSLVQKINWENFEFRKKVIQKTPDEEFILKKILLDGMYYHILKRQNL